MGIMPTAWADICYESDFTYDADQPFFVCQTACVASVSNSLSCTTARQGRICNELCGLAEDNSCKATTKNPINLSTGTKYSFAKDYQSAGEFPLQITRNYRSAYTPKSSAFGMNWNGVNTVKIVSKNFNAYGEMYTVTRADGRTQKYTWVSGGGGLTQPLKANTKETLTLFNYGVDDVPQI